LNVRLKVIIAEANMQHGIKLSRYLRSKNCDARFLHECFNATTLLDKISEYSPDVLVFNVQAFSCNISWLIEQICNKNSNLYIIMILPEFGCNPEKLICKKNVSCVYMPYNCNEVFEEIAIKNTFFENISMNDKIHYFIKNVGLSGKLKGYEYVCSAVYINLFESDKFPLITKDIYPEIALRHGSTSSNVERCIRNSINVFLSDSDNRRRLRNILYNSNLSVYKNLKNFKITNSKFIAILAEAFKNFYMN